MRIGIQTWGSHGDIRPFVALAEGLQLSGHEITLVITCVDSAEYNSSISTTNVKILNVASPVIKNQEDYKVIGKAIINETNPVVQAKKILELAFAPAEKEMYLASEKLCADNDLVIGHFFHYPLQTCAEKTGRPYISVMLQHNCIPSVFQSAAGVPNLGKFGNRLTWWLVKTLLNKSLKTYVDAFRKNQGLKPVNDLITDVWASHKLTLIAVSPEICQRQSDWPDYYQICGFLNMPNLSLEGKVTVDLENFLSNGDTPVYITFGSLMPKDIALQTETVKLLTDAVSLANCRAIIQASLWQQCGFISTANIYYVEAAPHAQVFPRCKLIIHHGGAGTTQSACAGGKPSVVVAHISEQEFWGNELSKKGIAPRVLVRRKLTSVKLAESIKRVISSSEMSEKAEAIGELMKKENGVDKAVSLINAKFNL